MTIGFFRRLLTTVSSVAVNTAQKYSPVPNSLKLQNIVVIHRHGDRSQITRELGPNYPENDIVTEKWKTLLPTQRSMRSMLLTTNHSHQLNNMEAESEIYGGWDAEHSPYAQLTDVGHQQLVEVGKTLRQRYGPLNVLPENIEHAYDHLYLRSTHMMRTQESLRSLLVGMFSVNPEDAHHNDPSHKPLHVLPHIHTRAEKHRETLFPAQSGPMTSHRTTLLKKAMANHNIHGYDELHKKLKNIIGGDMVNWIIVKEVLTCHTTHNISLVEDISGHELEKIDEVAGWMWGVLFKDKVLNRFAIGRFLNEMLEDMHAAMDKSEAASASAAAAAEDDANANTHACSDFDQVVRSQSVANKTALIYSGHDSTLVPVLCALEVYDDKWPPYASHLTFELAKSSTNDHMYVRAVYNDVPVKMYPKDERSDNSLGSEWMRFEEFENRLKELTLTHEEYDKAVEEHEKEAALAAEAKAVVDASLGGGKENIGDSAATLEK